MKIGQFAQKLKYGDTKTNWKTGCLFHKHSFLIFKVGTFRLYLGLYEDVDWIELLHDRV